MGHALTGCILQTRMKKKILKRIHVNQHNIRYNKKHGTNKPVITVKTSRSNDYGHEVDIRGDSRVIYSPDKPLSCGAKVWIETKAEVKIFNKENREEKTLGHNPLG